MRKKGGGFIVAGGADNPVPLDSVFRYSQQKIIIMNCVHPGMIQMAKSLN